MRFAGIDIASATHVLAIVGADSAVELNEPAAVPQHGGNLLARDRQADGFVAVAVEHARHVTRLTHASRMTLAARVSNLDIQHFRHGPPLRESIAT